MKNALLSLPRIKASGDNDLSKTSGASPPVGFVTPETLAEYRVAVKAYRAAHRIGDNPDPETLRIYHEGFEAMRAQFLGEQYRHGGFPVSCREWLLRTFPAAFSSARSGRLPKPLSLSIARDIAAPF